MSYPRRLLWYLLAGTKGGETRAEIIKALKERPYNANQLTKVLNLDYKTVKHHLNILMENRLITVEKEGRYGAVYILSDFMEENFHEFQLIWERIRVKKNNQKF
ncbi:MAG: winged helix-turn-helix domain-containing protein [Candidatus Bathyarchaeia archaeon]